MTIKTSMILAAGLGTRLRPITDRMPKPLIKLHNKTLLGYAIEMLKQIGVKKIIINTHYKANLINEYIKNNYPDTNIVISYEPKLLDTGGGIKKVIKQISGKYVLVINSDIFWNQETFIDVKNLINYHKKNCFDCTLLLSKLKNSYGINKKVGDFKFYNKSLLRNNNISKGLIYSGAQIINKNIFNLLKQKTFSFNKIWDLLIENNQLSGIIMKSNWLHVGDKKGLIKIKYFMP